jgi:hypothetical protein
MPYASIVREGQLSITEILGVLGLALIFFDPTKWQAVTKLSSSTIYGVGIALLIIGLLGKLGIVHM